MDVSNSLGKLHKDKGPRESQESIQAEWTKQCEQAFDQLKRSLTDTPSWPTQTQIDPMNYILMLAGMVLEGYGQWRLVAYVSRGLTPAEENYPTHKLEFLALKWAGE